LRKGPYKGRVSRQTLELARKNAQRMGRLGEELICSYLEQQEVEGIILAFILLQRNVADMI
jgi:hypothetical protein